MTKKQLFYILIGLVIIFAATAGFFIYKYQKAVKDPSSITKQETQWLVEKVGKLMDLPTDETPTIATVTDKEKLKSQTFFAKAENGDKVLIYVKAKKAILYRPSTNKIIEVSTINITENQQAITKTITIVLYNGTSTVGLSQDAEKDLKDKVKDIEIVSKENAKNKYDHTIVVDLSGTKKDKADEIAKALNGTVESLPADEQKPNADILIIIGK